MIRITKEKNKTGKRNSKKILKMVVNYEKIRTTPPLLTTTTTI